MVSKNGKNGKTQDHVFDYITAVMQDNRPEKTVSKRVWGIPLDTWIPFFVAGRVKGVAAALELSPEGLAVPVRKVYDEQTGDLRFTKTGRPMERVVKEISKAVGVARDNYVAALQAQTAQVRESDPEGYMFEVGSIQTAGRKYLKSLEPAPPKTKKKTPAAPEPPTLEISAPEPAAAN